MPTFSKKSLDRLATVDRKLYDICSEAIRTIDFSVICGHRGQEEQDAAVAAGKSHTPWPTSKHNSTPSQAVDLIPYPFNPLTDWKNIEKFRDINAHMQVAADKLGHKIRWGGTFTTIKDYDHWELI